MKERESERARERGSERRKGSLNEEQIANGK
jgi:hypothetical protein